MKNLIKIELDINTIPVGSLLSHTTFTFYHYLYSNIDASAGLRDYIYYGTGARATSNQDVVVYTNWGCSYPAPAYGTDTAYGYKLQSNNLRMTVNSFQLTSTSLSLNFNLYSTTHINIFTSGLSYWGGYPYFRFYFDGIIFSTCNKVTITQNGTSWFSQAFCSGSYL